MNIRTIKLSSRGQICIPRDIREELEIGEGASLVLISEKNQIVIKKSEDIRSQLRIAKESAVTMLLSEDVLKKNWENEYDERWNKY